jgi:hypothetical protein
MNITEIATERKPDRNPVERCSPWRIAPGGRRKKTLTPIKIKKNMYPLRGEPM